jgi:CelD/BcsL family acetyltransferase involved in cellulose biosynthesis
MEKNAEIILRNFDDAREAGATNTALAMHSVGIDGELLAGSLPVKQLKLVQAWLAIHEDELMPLGTGQSETSLLEKSSLLSRW